MLLFAILVPHYWVISSDLLVPQSGVQYLKARAGGARGMLLPGFIWALEEKTQKHSKSSDSAQPLLFEVVFTRFRFHTVLILSVSILWQGVGDALIQ